MQLQSTTKDIAACQNTSVLSVILFSDLKKKIYICITVKSKLLFDVPVAIQVFKTIKT